MTVEVSNAGPAPAPDVVFTDALPAGLGEVVLPDGCTLDAGAIMCAIGELAVDGSATRVITAPVDATAAERCPTPPS